MLLRNMNQKRFLTPLIAIILFVNGCSNITATSQQAATDMPLETLAPISPSATVSPTANIQPTPAITIAQECIPIEEKLPDDLQLSGVWVRNESAPYLESPDQTINRSIPLEGGGRLSPFTGMAISPDRKHLAYIDEYFDIPSNSLVKRILRIINSSGHSLNMDYWKEDWQWLMSWVDNRNLAVFTAKKEVVILNPFTGELKEISRPDWLSYGENYWDYPPPFSPTLDWVLDGTRYQGRVLKNFPTGNVIWKAGYAGPSSWSADGKILAVGTSDGGYVSVVNAGESTTKFNIRKITADPIYNISLSPDGQKLAFNTAASFDSDKLFILDLVQQKLSQLCANNIRLWYELIWSPDNRFVIQEVYQSYYVEYDLLIDTQQMHAYKLVSGRYNHRIAWLAKP